MFQTQDRSHEHKAILSLNDAAWTISCARPEAPPLTEQSLPKYVLEALHNEHRIPDPLSGKNEDDLRWVAEETWIFQRNFDMPNVIGQYLLLNTELILDGVDTIATVCLNGTRIAYLQNAHRQYRIDVTKHLKPMGNTIRVTLKPAAAEALKRKQAYPYEVPFVQAPRALPHYNFLRKPAADFGWDWGPAFAAAGLGSVALEASKDTRITSVTVRQDHKANGDIAILFDVTLKTAPQGWRRHGQDICYMVGVYVEGGYAGGTDPEGVWELDAPVMLKKATAGSEISVTVQAVAEKHSVELWWPNGMGQQHMYTFTVCLFNDCYDTSRSECKEMSVISRTDVRVGARDIRLVRQPLPHSTGETFEFHVNGVPMFAKGANIIPLDIMPSRVTKEYMQQLVQSAKEAHMNMLRVWGGGGYLPDEFYEACSEAGILIWQEAMFACAFYPRDAAFLEEVEEEVRYQSRRLNRYTCMAVWGGNNELEPALGWFPESQENPILYAVDFADTFVNTIRPILCSVDSGKHAIPFVDSSPSNGILSEDPYVKRWGDSGSADFGDVHYYNYNDDVLDPKIYPRAKFISEFGFQSWPSWQLYRQVTERADWSPHSDMSEFRMRHPNGIAELEAQLARHFRLPQQPPGGSAEAFQKSIFLTQIQQGLCYETALSYWRSLKSDPEARTMGILYWQLNDVWAGPSWSTLDVGGNPKLSHHFVRSAYAPEALWGHVNRHAGTVIIHLLSDLAQPLKGELVAVCVPWVAKNMEQCPEALKTDVSMPSGQSMAWHSTAVAMLPLKELEACLGGSLSAGFLSVTFTGHSKGNAHTVECNVFLTEFKDAQMQEPCVGIASVTITSASTAAIEIRSEAPAALVALGTQQLQGSFTPQAFALCPWEPRTVHFTSSAQAPLAREELLRDISFMSVQQAMA